MLNPKELTSAYKHGIMELHCLIPASDPVAAM